MMTTWWLSGAASAHARPRCCTSSRDALPPYLPGQLARLPTRITTLTNGVCVASEDVPIHNAKVAMRLEGIQIERFQGPPTDAMEWIGASHPFLCPGRRSRSSSSPRTSTSNMSKGGGGHDPPTQIRQRRRQGDAIAIASSPNSRQDDQPARATAVASLRS
ncbi:hypothetical protein ZWY2020_054879 [Hordeum vulgare]|nr:hypothetical protein ZWY2020_054879 [Hordeum vulgare]